MNRTTRLETWIAEEIAMYEANYGTMSAQERERYEARLAGTLHGAQLALADTAGGLGDTVLAALKSHSDRLRDTAVVRWLRDPR